MRCWLLAAGERRFCAMLRGAHFLGSYHDSYLHALEPRRRIVDLG
ncbi:hypothetical protein [Paraburkholderia fynbosensis]|uniref:Uncharacterized protein n=1 Tax=Paraburkholderia fynbosensis TaxID=1200993 RepID=A0A6J5H576_9BURK|nr:hypothetical protein [Paraburkholderia fynbosensis]CAB3810782.1 hypothetical protein LMG27177_07462 [Paraburkholderia fynbosensis]